MLKVSASSRFHTVHPDGRFSGVEMVEHFHKVGFEGIDFDLEAVTDYMDKNEWKKELSEIVDCAARLGVGMDFGHLPFHKKYGDPRSATLEGLGDIMRWGIEAAGFAGIKNAVVHPIGKPAPYEEYDAEANFKRNVEYFTPFAELAVKHGVCFAFENMVNAQEKKGRHRFGTYAEEIARLADWFGMGNCWDFGHANVSGVPQGDSLRYLGKRLTVLHVNDNQGDTDDHLLPFFGTVNWNEAMQGLKDSGFDGYLNYECRMLKIPAELRDEIGAYAVALGKKLQSL